MSGTINSAAALGVGARKIGDEIANREINFVSDGGDDRHAKIDNRTRDNLFVELPQIFHAAAAARDHD